MEKAVRKAGRVQECVKMRMWTWCDMVGGEQVTATGEVRMGEG